MQTIDAKKLPIRIGEGFREHFIDGPISVSDVSGVLIVTLSNVRPTIDPAMAAGKMDFEVVAQCRLTLPIHVAQRLVDVIGSQLTQMKQVPSERG